MAKSPRYEYGRSPNPTNWYETADAIRSNSPTRRKSNRVAMNDGNGTYSEDLKTILEKLKEKK